MSLPVPLSSFSLQPNASRLWHCVVSGRAINPVTEAQLVQGILSSQVSGSDSVWTDGLQAWSKVHEIAILSHYIPALATSRSSPLPVQAARTEPLGAGFGVAGMGLGMFAILAALGLDEESIDNEVLVALLFAGLAIGLSSVGIDRMRRGTGMAVAGLVLGILATFIAVSSL